MRKNNYICLAAALCAVFTFSTAAGANSFLDAIDETVFAVNSGLNTNNNLTTTVIGAGNVFTQITDDTIVTIENGKKTVTRIGGNSYESAAAGVSKAADDISNQVNNTINKANSAIDKMNADLDRAFGELNRAVGGINEGLKKASGDVKTVTNTTIDKAGNTVTNTVNSVNSGVTRISESNQVITINNGISSVSGRVNETVEAAGAGASNIAGRVNEIIGSVNNTINPMANSNANQPVNTPVNQINLNNVTGNPESVYSEKALEGMALLGDRWARLKLDEIRAQKMAEIMYNQYKSISWFNIFKKLDAYSNYKNAKNYYIAAAEQTRQYELANPNSGGIIGGIDQISESVLEFKALFGDKEAKAQLEVLRARREYEKIKLQYDSAGLFEKLKYRGELQYAKTRYEEALKAFEIIKRGAAGTRIVSDSTANNKNITTVDNSYNTNTVTNTVTNANNNTQTTIVKDNTVTDKNGGFVIKYNDDPSIYANNASLASAKAKMDAAYKNYIDYMSLPNPSQSKLEQLYKEYIKAIEVFQNVAHSR